MHENADLDAIEGSEPGIEQDALAAQDEDRLGEAQVSAESANCGLYCLKQEMQAVRGLGRNL